MGSRLIRVRMVGVGLACAAVALALVAGIGSAARTKSGNEAFLKLTDDEGVVKGDVIQKNREGFFTVQSFSLTVDSGGCSPLVASVPLNDNWGRLSSDVGEAFSIAELRLFSPKKTAQATVSELRATYAFNSAVLTQVEHEGSDRLTLTFVFPSVDITQKNRTDTINCIGT
jgi:hypothetical protein